MSEINLDTRGRFLYMHVHMAPGVHYLLVCQALTCTVEKEDGLFFVERSHAHQSTLPVSCRETSTQRREKIWRRSYGGMEEKNRKRAAMAIYSPRPFNGPFNTASSAPDMSQALHLAAAVAPKAICSIISAFLHFCISAFLYFCICVVCWVRSGTLPSWCFSTQTAQ